MFWPVVNLTIETCVPSRRYTLNLLCWVVDTFLLLDAMIGHVKILKVESESLLELVLISGRKYSASNPRSKSKDS